MESNELEQLFNVEIWDQLSLTACEEVAQVVAARLHSSFRFMQVRTCESGMQRHHVALFEWDKGSFQEDFLEGNRGERGDEENLAWEMDISEGEYLQWGYPHPDASLFALIPGGKTMLGYDADHTPFVPSEDLVKDWQMDAGCFIGEDLPGDKPWTYEALYAYLANTTFSGREITPYDVFSFYLKHIMLPVREVTIRPFLLEVVAEKDRRGSLSHAELTTELAQQGFRLPSADEWEYACAAGSRTLFFWGDDIPEGVSSMGIPFAPNAFGLFVANHCYQWEYCADPFLIRGGDGGYAACGGSGKLAEFLPLASAYTLKLSDVERHRGMCGVHVRRAFSLF